MPDPISPDDVRRTARLARLAVPDAACPDIAHKLSAVIDHMACLQTLDLEGIEPMAHVSFEDGIDETQLRDDAEGPTLAPGTVARVVPDAHEEPRAGDPESPADVFIKVPKVIGGESSS